MRDQRTGSKGEGWLGLETMRWNCAESVWPNVSRRLTDHSRGCEPARGADELEAEATCPSRDLSHDQDVHAGTNQFIERNACSNQELPL